MLPNGQIELRKGVWSEVISPAQLPDRLAFYKRLRDRKGGRYAAKYKPTIKALEAILSEVQP